MPGITTEFSLLLVDIGEAGTNDLRLNVLEARPGPDLFETEVGLATPIRPDENSRGYELTWYGYVAYSVRNESYFRAEAEEPEAKLDRLVVRKRSAYMDYLAAATIATNDYPGELTHWSLYTEWHCIDVVSVEPPELRELSKSEIAAYLGSGD